VTYQLGEIYRTQDAGSTWESANGIPEPGRYILQQLKVITPSLESPDGSHHAARAPCHGAPRPLSQPGLRFDVAGDQQWTADPSDSNRMIKYTSVEGPEAAIYVRGTTNLVSGQGHIEFSDHFAVMAVPSSITVSLIPRSARSMGLATVGVSSQGIDVAELGGGTNSYSFDYVAYAVRKGFEDYEVYLTQEQVRGLTGQARTLEVRPRSLLTTSPLKAIQRQQ